MINALQRAICHTHKTTRKLHGVWSLAAWQERPIWKAGALNCSGTGGVSYATHAPIVFGNFFATFAKAGGQGAYLRDVELESEGQSMTGDELHAELKRRGWSQTELAKCLGVWTCTVNRWRHGRLAIHPAVVAYLRDVPREPEIAGEQAAQALPDMQAEIVALTERLRAAEREVADKGEQIAWLRGQVEAAQRDS